MWKLTVLLLCFVFVSVDISPVQGKPGRCDCEYEPCEREFCSRSDVMCRNNCCRAEYFTADGAIVTDCLRSAA
ncbi:hypothetical protein V1264_002258 [Littorina saxatilis]